jgi:hypothetical protein
MLTRARMVIEIIGRHLSYSCNAMTTTKLMCVLDAYENKRVKNAIELESIENLCVFLLRSAMSMLIEAFRVMTLLTIVFPPCFFRESIIWVRENVVISQGSSTTTPLLLLWMAFDHNFIAVAASAFTCIVYRILIQL